MGAEKQTKATAAIKKVPTFLSGEMLLETRDELRIEKVDLVDKFGEVRGFVFVREMSGKEKNVWERSMMKKVITPGGTGNEYETTLEDYKAKLACVTVCDELGNLQFDMRNVQKLSLQLSATNLEAIANKAQEVNAISQKDKEEILGN